MVAKEAWGIKDKMGFGEITTWLVITTIQFAGSLHDICYTQMRSQPEPLGLFGKLQRDELPP